MGEWRAPIQIVDVYRDPAGRWTIRPYRPGDEERILDLFSRVFRVERSIEHWRWKFRDNPAGQYHMRLAETPSGELVGQYAGLPVRMAWGEKTLVFDQVIDVMLDPVTRLGLKRTGLFFALANQGIGGYAGSDKVSGGYGFPTPEALRIGQRAAGYTPMHPVVGLVLDLRQDGQNHSKVLAGGDRSRLYSRFYRVREIERFGQEVDRLWEQARQELPVAVVRDARYLNWRYAACPDVRYTMLEAFHRLTGALAGVAILRMGVRGEPVAALVDWLVPGRAIGAGVALLARCAQLAAQAGMRQMQAWFPGYTRPFRLLQRRGFRPEETMYEFVALSMSPEVTLDWTKECWYYTMGDSDIY
ncbi:MAG: GNAT family N-acetyltransferase [Candidatus Methylomirabilis oxyfera]|nr:GNAT family N-acetyltransferase [Candidatus Methylomirabilis oxyfera]